MSDLQLSYDILAREYAERFSHEFDHKALDCFLLDRFAEKMRGHGLVCDMGCGSGHLARYLQERGVDVFGIDLSRGMVAVAKEQNPGTRFIQGDMRHIPVADNAWIGIAAFYCIIHIPRNQVVDALTEMRRVLQPGGVLFFSFHKGTDTIHLEEWWGKQVSMDFYYFTKEEMLAYLITAGFHVEMTIERYPYLDFEYPSQRVYIQALKSEEY